MQNRLPLVALGLLLPVWAAAETIRYDDLPRLVSASNRLVAAQRRVVVAQEQRQGQLLRSYLPRFDLQGGYESMDSGSRGGTTDPFWRTAAALTLFRGGQDFQEGAIRRQQLAAAKNDQENSRRLQLLQARQLFWQIVALQAFTQIQSQALEANPKHLQTARRRVAAGLATPSDPIEFELQQTVLEQDFKRLVLDLDKAKNQLSVILVMSDHKELAVAEAFPPPPADELQSSVVAYDQTPQLQQHRLASDILKADARKHRRGWWPQLDLFSTLARVNEFEPVALSSDEFTELSLGLRLQLDLADAVSLGREARAKESLAQGAQLKAAHQQSVIAAQVHELKHDMKLLYGLLDDADKSVTQAQKFLELTLAEYGRGAKNGGDVLEAAQKQIHFERRRTELYRDYYLAHSELLALVE